MLRYFPLLFKNSLRNRRRSLLTVASMALSFCLLGVLFAMYQALFLAKPKPGQELRLILRHRVSLTQSFPGSYEDRVRRVPGVKEVSLYQWFGGTYKDSRDPNNMFARFGVEPQQFLTVHPEITLEPAARDRFLRERTAAIASAPLARKCGWQAGEKIVLQGDIYPVNLELTLVGVFNSEDGNEAVYFNYEYPRQGLPAARKDLAGAFQILVNSADDVPRVAKEIDAMFENSPAQTKTESEQAFALSFVSFLGNVKVFLLAICGAVTFTILLVSANTMAMSVRERIREVGVMKTLGYTTETILGLILGEAAVIGTIGGLVGLLLASGLAAAVRQGPGFLPALKTLSLEPEAAALAMAVAVFTAVASSAIPAWNAARTPILDSLRNTG